MLLRASGLHPNDRSKEMRVVRDHPSSAHRTRSGEEETRNTSRHEKSIPKDSADEQTGTSPYSCRDRSRDCKDPRKLEPTDRSSAACLLLDRHMDAAGCLATRWMNSVVQ